MLKVGSDFSGVGAFNQALTRLGVEYQEVFACDMDKYARQTFIHNYGEPKYYPTNVYDREIPSESLDIYMTSPPCQTFSLAGKRLGKDDKRGILFFNSYEFIQKNNPRFFIFENVKGLLSDDGGNTFQEWINMLGGRSVNGLPILFPYDNALPYHLYWQVLNAKHHGVPQNRERVFLIGIRDDKDNNFRFPAEEHLSKRLKDVLEEEVDDKYFLSDVPEQSKCIISGYNKIPFDGQYIKVIQLNSSKESGGQQPYQQNRIFDINGISPALLANLGGDRNHNIVYNIKRLNETLQKHTLPEGEVRFVDSYNQTIHENSACINARINATNDRHLWDGYKIRRLTPRECFRLMDFPDTFTWDVSDSQAYKQAGNSIVVRVLEKIIKNCTQIICIDSNELIESCMELPAGLNPQQVGSAVTYFRRYCSV
jgi:DNA (cytosine-5)-methyltransferase 1